MLNGEIHSKVDALWNAFWIGGASNPIEVIEQMLPLAIQREFARRATVVEKLKTAQRASLAELDALFATLQHRAFRGEL